MAATLKDIAKRAGVTEMTVSNVLNERYKPVRAGAIKRARRIRAIAAELSYRPHASAKAMAEGRFGALGLLLSTDMAFSLVPGGLLTGIQGAMTEHELHLIVEAMPDQSLTSEDTVPRLLRQLACDGLLVNYNARIPARMIELLDRYDVPAVWINSKHEKDCVYPDDFGAARAATQRLIDLGHRHIAYLDFITPADPDEAHYSGPDRAAGYRAVMQRHGLEPRTYGSQRSYYLHRMVDDIGRILDQPDPPTALLCYGQAEASASMVAAAHAKLRVPGDLSVMALAAKPNSNPGPPLTFMELPQSAIGRHAVDMLIEKIDNPDVDLPPVAVPFMLEPGGTVSERQ